MIDVAHNRNHRRTWNQSLCGLFARALGAHLFFRLLLEGDYAGIGAKLTRHIRCQFCIECLVDGRKHAARKQTSDHVFCADFQLLGQILHADTFGNRDGARDRQRLVRNHHARWRNKALHRAFLHPTRNIALSWTPRRRGPSRRPSCRRRRNRTNTCTAHRTCSRRSRTRRMHRTTLARTQWRTIAHRAAARTSLRTWTLENRLAGNWTSTLRTRTRGTGYRSRWSRRRQIHWARTGLRNNESSANRLSRHRTHGLPWSTLCWTLRRWC